MQEPQVARITAEEFHQFILRVQAARIQGMLDARKILHSHTLAAGYRLLDARIQQMSDELTASLAADDERLRQRGIDPETR